MSDTRRGPCWPPWKGQCIVTALSPRHSAPDPRATDGYGNPPQGSLNIISRITVILTRDLCEMPSQSLCSEPGTSFHVARPPDSEIPSTCPSWLHPTSCANTAACWEWCRKGLDQIMLNCMPPAGAGPCCHWPLGRQGVQDAVTGLILCPTPPGPQVVPHLTQSPVWRLP